MDMLDQALEASEQKNHDSNNSDDVTLTHHDPGDHEEHATIANVQTVGGQALALDPNIQYQLRADTGQGQVTYRVVQVAGDGNETTAQVVASNAFPQVTQAVIQSPFSNGGSPTLEGQDTKFTYFPAVSGTGVEASQPEVISTAGMAGQVTTAGGWAQDGSLGQGQFYVMMSPQEVLQGQRNIAPRTGFATPKVEGARSGRDDRRRATHNEVERRRRDKINNWIVQLSKVVPDCSSDHTKQGQVTNKSKGGILSKACDYITELRTSNARMAENLKESERLQVDLELLRQQCEELKSENQILRTQLQQHGIIPDISGTGS
ncbi:upstream stimulatory factor 1-like isoform X2 [Mytilus galloprovincialis]|uniref:Upstream stimulatory factor n=1 Tax=Mytilus galloprovincialis TaxID=29158 RepID=A0A8B6DLM5_MYTGA|nr:upstream stimulatory factor [Mytilus galloprovincialis]